ncbi:LacI family DNA-binding transcriptional regulator [Gracilibacillus alcaliphilus]|uniref:LacI family DNA-binding transcriptional regulator n=1 Tax=Gracilibacillus alcaliphilus TaxID=1401441 RepID=UPI00195EF70D|nr:LacI family DNA-binding transcriptional regulator [Gracilibacillus alcaliphilus]MBM7675236.1 LacI family transcriptional regulator [Gracilibacillus alcaliphilus]
MPTLKDVAKKANVSISTVSYVINGSKLISKGTREKVLQAARDLGYHPNGNAKNLKKNKSEIIGLFLSGFKGPFFNEMLEGIQNEVEKNGYEMVVCASADMHRLLKERYVGGAIILNYHIDNDLLHVLASEKYPFVVLDREIDNPHIEQILLPNKQGIEQSVDHLIQRGHRRIGFIAGGQQSFDGEKRLEGFQESMEQRGLVVSPKDIIRADFTEVSGLLTMKEYLKQEADYPTAFISANDEMAMGAIKAVQQKGMQVPNDIAFVGFDNIEIAKYFQPALSTVQVNQKEWGAVAAKMLFDKINKTDFNKQTSIPIEFIERESS